jgi:hypothetical protein
MIFPFELPAGKTPNYSGCNRAGFNIATCINCASQKKTCKFNRLEIRRKAGLQLCKGNRHFFINILALIQLFAASLTGTPLAWSGTQACRGAYHTGCFSVHSSAAMQPP